MLYSSLRSKWLCRMSHELKEAKEQIQSLRKWTKQELTSSAQCNTQQQDKMVPYCNNNEHFNKMKCTFSFFSFFLRIENQMGELFKVPSRTFMSVSLFRFLPRFYLLHAPFFYLTVAKKQCIVLLCADYTAAFVIAEIYAILSSSWFMSGCERLPGISQSTVV